MYPLKDMFSPFCFSVKEFYTGKILVISEAHSRYISKMAFYCFSGFIQGEAGTSNLLYLNEQACNSTGFISYCRLLGFLS